MVGCLGSWWGRSMVWWSAHLPSYLASCLFPPSSHFPFATPPWPPLHRPLHHPFAPQPGRSPSCLRPTPPLVDQVSTKKIGRHLVDLGWVGWGRGCPTLHHLFPPHEPPPLHPPNHPSLHPLCTPRPCTHFCTCFLLPPPFSLLPSPSPSLLPPSSAFCVLPPPLSFLPPPCFLLPLPSFFSSPPCIPPGPGNERPRQPGCALAGRRAAWGRRSGRQGSRALRPEGCVVLEAGPGHAVGHGAGTRGAARVLFYRGGLVARRGDPGSRLSARARGPVGGVGSWWAGWRGVLMGSWWVGGGPDGGGGGVSSSREAVGGPVDGQLVGRLMVGW